MKRIRKSIPIIISFILFLSISGFDSFSQTGEQEQIFNKITTQLVRFNNAFPQEKIYLHFDKPFYIPGETIWYKAYLVNATGNIPSSLSKIIYTELVDRDGKILIRQTLKTSDGFTHGDFLLPEFLAPGKYMVRAYTNWMRNFDKDFLFTKEILLFDPQTEYDIPETDSSEQVTGDEPVSKKIDITFFPEGGYLASGLTSKVAFKAIDGSGEGIHVKGEIIDQNGNIITPFESFHFGMGAFMLKPEKRKTYSANIIQENNKKINYALPTVLEEGLVMAVDNSSGDFIRIIVQANRTFVRRNSKDVLLVVQSAGKIYYTANGNLRRRSSFVANIPKKGLPAGIIQLTLFNGEGNPECERLVFINCPDALQVTIETDKKVYAPRERVVMDVSVSDFNGNPVAGNFSLAVTDAGQVGNPGKYNDNILTNLLLTSELKGNIEQPAFYFDEDNPGSIIALDYLMLTQGWRRFLWKEILNDKWPAINYNIEKSTIVRKGQVLDPSNNSPVALQNISFLMLRRKRLYERITDENGFFTFFVDASDGKESLFFTVWDKDGPQTGYEVIINEELPGCYFTDREEISYRNQIMENYLEKRKVRAHIESSFNYTTETGLINVADTKGIDPGIKSDDIINKSSHIIIPDEYIAFPVMEEVFIEIVPQVTIKHIKGEVVIRVYSDENMKNFDHTPLFFIDGIPTFNQDFVLDLDPNNVERIEVLQSAEIIHPAGSLLGNNGIIAIYTKNGAFSSADIPENYIMEFEGYYNAREFYSPIYGDSRVIDRSKPDLRSLIYWEPLLITDSNGKASVSFCNTDNITTINARIEGISYDGSPGLAGYKYKIVYPE
ncbi:MAG: hypothetical protein IMY71_14295 [Bacteroidetes bacterium]|nr:hypothetical protein [Bacteroidota bacterium]